MSDALFHVAGVGPQRCTSPSLPLHDVARSTTGLSAVLSILFGLSACHAPPPLLEPALLPEEDPPKTVRTEEGGPLVIPRGAGFGPLEIPREERLEYVVEIDVGILGDLAVGRVLLSTGLEPYVPGLPAPGEPAVDPSTVRKVGWIKSQARGAYLGYELRHELEARHLPQAWPGILYRDTQAGSENRRRELRIGLLDGEMRSVYRNDGHCKGCDNPEHFVESTWLWGKPYHCKKCKRGEHRVWHEPDTRSVPPGTVDLLSAVYLARSMIAQGKSEATFPVLDKKKLWILTVTRGAAKTVETPAGRFTCVLAQLTSRPPPGEPIESDRKFQGLFGIQGTIKIWMDAETGVPVMISGELPVPVLDTLDVNVVLESYRGTPARFAPYR